MNVTREKNIRNLVCIQYSIVKMLLVIAGFELLGRGLSLMQGTQSATQEIEGEVIWSEETKTEENPLIVCVDAGHGGKDNGSDYKGRYEKDDNLKLAQAVSAYLADKNVKVVMTRSDDTFLRLSERCGIANQSGADYMLSLHRNDGEGNGVETWISASGSEETDALANHIMEVLDTAGIQRNRGVKKGTQTGNPQLLSMYIRTCRPASSRWDLSTMHPITSFSMKSWMRTLPPSVTQCLQRRRHTVPTRLRMETVRAQAKREAAPETVKVRMERETAPETIRARMEREMTPETDRGRTKQEAAPETVRVLQVEMRRCRRLRLTGWIPPCRAGGWEATPMRTTARTMLQSMQQKYRGVTLLFIGENTKTIYLTFDKGYEYGYTESILDTLKEKGVHAVFFVTEPYAKAEPALVQRMIDEGHVVGNHSVTHPSAELPFLTVEQQQEGSWKSPVYQKAPAGCHEMNLFAILRESSVSSRSPL